MMRTFFVSENRNMVRIGIAILLLAALAGIASATPVTWTLSGVAFSGGGTASGSFVYDADTNTYSSVNITTTTGGTRSGATYIAACLGTGVTCSATTLQLFTAAAGPFTGLPNWYINFSTALTNSGGTKTVTGGQESNCPNAGCSSPQAPSRSVSAGGQVTAPAAATAPGAPTSVSAVAGNAQAAVSFTAPASNGGSAITGYTVTSSPGGLTATGASSPLTVTGLTNGTAYTFTVTATNAIGTSAASTASSAVTPTGATAPGAPTSVSAVAGNAQAAVSFTAPASNGGSAITGYTVTSSPGGLTATGATSPLTVTGLTNGTAYTFTVTATNAIGTSAASTASTAVTPAVVTTTTLSVSNASPVFGQSVTFTARVTPGTATGTVNFVDGSTVIATVALSGGVATYTTSTLAIASHSVTAVYAGDTSNAASTSAAVVVGIGPRPNPTVDTSVRGVVGAQGAIAQRFVQVQITNVSGHLQQLHGSFDIRQNRVNIGLRYPREDQYMPVLNAVVSFYDYLTAGHSTPPSQAFTPPKSGFAPIKVASADDRLPAISGNEVSTPQEGKSPPSGSMLNTLLFGDRSMALWASGNVEYGSLALQDGATNRFSTKGITVGLDFQVAKDLIVGAALGYANDNTNVDSLGSASRSHQTTGSVYASYQPVKDWFVDALAGYGKLSSSNDRWSATDGTLLSGNRDGRAAYLSLGLSNQFMVQEARIQAFGRADLASARLDSYAEQGGILALSYDALTVSNRALSAGVVASRDFPTAAGVLTPSAKFQLTRNSGGSFSQGVYYADLGPGSTNYNFNVNALPVDVQSFGLGMNFTSKSRLSMDFGWLGSLGSDSYHANSFRVNARIPF